MERVDRATQNPNQKKINLESWCKGEVGFQAKSFSGVSFDYCLEIQMKTIVLPGLDGTDWLLDPFCAHAPESHDVTVWPLPDTSADYRSLCEHFSDGIRRLGSCHLVAESFSGPLGILLASRHPEVVKRLTLVATFATTPTPWFARFVPWTLLFSLPLPAWVARRYFVGSKGSLIQLLRRAIRQSSRQVLAGRMRCVMNVDVTAELSDLNCKAVYVRPKNDRLVPLDSLTTILNTNPSIAVCELDGPHLILQTQPKEVWKRIVLEYRDAP